MRKKPKAPTRGFERASRKTAKQRFKLRLYLSGTSALSQRALAAVKNICERYLPGRYDLEVVDVYQASERVRADQVVAVPTLIKLQPAPLKKLIGDFSDERRVLAGLGIAAFPLAPASPSRPPSGEGPQKRRTT